MKLLVDEDLASKELRRRLHEHFPGQILVSAPGSADDEVWQDAQREGAAIVTANVVDFVRIADARPNHHGLLVVYRRNDRTKDLRAADISARLAAIADLYPHGLDGLTIVVNAIAVHERPGVTR